MGGIDWSLVRLSTSVDIRDSGAMERLEAYFD
jgi:hypothetical protein